MMRLKQKDLINEILNLSDEKENNLDSDKSNEQLDDLYATALEIVKSNGDKMIIESIFYKKAGVKLRADL